MERTSKPKRTPRGAGAGVQRLFTRSPQVSFKQRGLGKRQTQIEPRPPDRDTIETMTKQLMKKARRKNQRLTWAEARKKTIDWIMRTTGSGSS